MKESEFLELLNLYLDHEISPADALRLEQEVMSNPSRRAVYRTYCRMHKACGLLAADLQKEGALAPGDRRGDGEAYANASVGRASRVGYYVAGSLMAAAAGLALVFWLPILSKPREVRATIARALPGEESGAELSPGSRPMAPAGVGQRGLVSVATPLGSPREKGQIRLIAGSLVLSGSRQPLEIATAMVTAGDDQLAWMRDFQMVSLQERQRIEQLRFESVPVSLRPDGRQLGVPAPQEAAAETTAFRFVR
ncbi:MAG: zf-HC2 domain-containing protein [Verrucomicrobia bacterium]|nr:zf-HC2 domain-containing protein [Verrucomicrobiota bacterium]